MENLAACIEQACVLEATARKPGNVHPGASFDDLTYNDFLRAAAVSAPLLAQAASRGIGWAVWSAVQATRSETGKNVNLGICLLLAPLAMGAAENTLWAGARRAVQAATVHDTELVYRAIRLAQPGGLGQSPEQDISQPPTLPLQNVMRLAADRDDVARELATGYLRLEQMIVPWLMEAWEQATSRPLSPPEPITLADLEEGKPALPNLSAMPPWEQAVVLTHLRLIADGDTLIRRKCGDNLCREAAAQATQLWQLWQQTRDISAERLSAFDRWLRADGHRRNPGTSADLIAAALFTVLVEQRVPLPRLTPGRTHRPQADGIPGDL